MLDQAGSSMVGPPSAAALPEKVCIEVLSESTHVYFTNKTKKLQIYVLFKRRSIYIEIHFWVIYYHQVNSIRW
jgi:hypothetical protein